MSKVQRVVTLLVFTLILCSLAAPAMAAKDLGEIAQGLTDQANYVGILLAASGAVLGVFCLLWGGLQLKKASNNRGDASVGKGIAGILVGVLLVCAVALAASGSKTIFGEESSMNERVSDFQ